MFSCRLLIILYHISYIIFYMLIGQYVTRLTVAFPGLGKADLPGPPALSSEGTLVTCLVHCHRTRAHVAPLHALCSYTKAV